MAGAALELLAPARDADIGVAAIDHGADAVYIGGPDFGARANAGNTVADIERLARHAHRYHAHIFVTLNTILRDDELEPARRLAWQLYEAGADALIVQDMGLLALDLPPLQLHASTQTDIRSPQKARFLQDVGFSQMVLARELTLPQIQAIAAEVRDAVAQGRKVLVLTERTEHLDAIKTELDSLQPAPFVLHGRMSRKQRATLVADLDALPPDAPRVLLSTGKLVGEGTAMSLPGGPLAGLRFLLKHLAERNRPLKAGQYVSTGAITGVHDIVAGQSSRLSFGPDGEIVCRAVAAKPAGGK